MWGAGLGMKTWIQWEEISMIGDGKPFLLSDVYFSLGNA
jgi:hypothetical protein